MVEGNGEKKEKAEDTKIQVYILLFFFFFNINEITIKAYNYNNDYKIGGIWWSTELGWRMKNLEAKTFVIF